MEIIRTRMNLETRRGKHCGGVALLGAIVFMWAVIVVGMFTGAYSVNLFSFERIR